MPLIFSVHEAKGLEHHVVLLGMISGPCAAYTEIRVGVTRLDLQQSALDCRLAKDTSDQSLRRRRISPRRRISTPLRRYWFPLPSTRSARQCRRGLSVWEM